MTEKERYIETYLETVPGAERDDWTWDDDEDLPKFLSRDVSVHGNDTCSFENAIGAGDGYGFWVGWVDTRRLEEGNGVQGFRVGGDWEHPVQAFGFRWPDSTVPGCPEDEIGIYVPEDGNLFNPHTDYPLGNVTRDGGGDRRWLKELDMLEEDERIGDVHAYDLTPLLDYGAMFGEFEEWLNARKE